MDDYIILITGIACAGFGGELFVRGTVRLARWARVSSGIVSATIAAFATSSPELSVSINAALAGNPQIALGDALGSNVVNIALILGITLVISGIQCHRGSIKRDFPVALFVPVLTGGLFMDGMISRLDGVLMLILFLIWLAMAIIEVRKQRSETEPIQDNHHGWMAMFFCITGLAALIVAGNLIVTGAKAIAVDFGIDEFIIGTTVVALGTSVPELATTVIATIHKEEEVSLGTILGSNIFNGLLIIAFASIIEPIIASELEVSVTLLFGFVSLVLIHPTGNGFLGRGRGLLLLILYGTYLAVIVQF